MIIGTLLSTLVESSNTACLDGFVVDVVVPIVVEAVVVATSSHS